MRRCSAKAIDIDHSRHVTDTDGTYIVKIGCRFNISADLRLIKLPTKNKQRLEKHVDNIYTSI